MSAKTLASKRFVRVVRHSPEQIRYFDGCKYASYFLVEMVSLDLVSGMSQFEGCWWALAMSEHRLYILA